MASKLQCEICGGKLIGRPNGIFECDSCGMEYDTAWAKQKIQEITGTVRIEGPVEIKGTVKVDNGEKVALLQRGMMVLEEEKWDEAKKFFDQALNYDAQFSEAYLGLAMAEKKFRDRAEFEKSYCDPYSRLQENTFVQRAKQYAKKDLALDFESLDKRASEAASEVRSHDKNIIDTIIELRNHPARKLLQVHSRGDVYGLKTDGTVLLYCNDRIPERYREVYKEMREAISWNNVVAISVGENHILGLRQDGTVLAAGDNTYGQCEVSNWRNIEKIKSVEDYSLGIKKDGTVVVTGNWKSAVDSWTDIVDLFVLEESATVVFVGLKKNGTVILDGRISDWQKYLYKELTNWKGITKILHFPFRSGGIWTGNLLMGIKQDGTVIYWENGDNRIQIKPGDIIIDIDKTYDDENVILLADRTVRREKNTIMKDVFEICSVSTAICGLTTNGRVLSNNISSDPSNVNVSQWKNIIGIFRYFYNFSPIGSGVFGLCKDGRVLATDEYYELSSWQLFDSYENIYLEQKDKIAIADRQRKKAEEHAEIEKRIKVENLKNEMDALQTELSNLTSFFSGKRRKQIQSRLSEIDTELNMLK